jgi:hypothetical protein
MKRFAPALPLGLLLAVMLGGCSKNSDTKPQTAAPPKPEAAPEPSFRTLILGKWRSVGPSLEQVWEFKENGVVNLTSTVSGKVQANKVIPKDEPIALGSFSSPARIKRPIA